jgi:LuxR family transcriptional regulator, maltose regulon positive regulatory protein
VWGSRFWKNNASFDVYPRVLPAELQLVFNYRSCTDIYTFWLYSIAALTSFLKDDSLFSYIKCNPDTSRIEEILQMLADKLAGDQDWYIVFDDLQYITDKTLIHSLDFFLSILPDNVHVFILSREAPPVYLGRFAVTGRLLFIGADELKLSEQESLDFLQKTLGLTENGNELEYLISYAEGWIGGLQLAAAAAGTGMNNTGISGTGAQGGKIVAEYLNHEIFSSLSVDEQTFLIRTGVLSYFDADICSYCLEGYTTDRFNSLIASLTGKKFFLICIDESAGVYRYHNILSDFLAGQFGQMPDAEQKDFLRKAAQAFEKRNEISEALRLLLTAELYDEAVRIAADPVNSIETWKYFDQIPLHKLVTVPELAFKSFLYNIGIFNISRCRILYDAFLAANRGTTLETVMRYGEAYVTKDTNMLLEYSPLTTEQIDALPLSAALKAIVYIENAAALIDNLAYNEAEMCIEKALNFTAEGSSFVNLFGWGQKAQLYEEIGQLNESLSCYHTELQLYEALPVVPGIGTNFYIGAAGVYMRRMELVEAQHMIDESRRIYENTHERADIIDMTVTYHCAEMEFLKGNEHQGKQLVNDILNRYSGLNTLSLGRLLMEEACTGVLDQELGRRFLQQLELSSSRYKSSLFMKLLKARIYALENKKETAFGITGEVLAAAREHGNRLRLTEGTLQKLYLFSRFPSVNTDGQKNLDLLRESIAAAWENHILMPYFLERVTVLPLLQRLLALPSGRSGLSPGEQQFIQAAISVCSFGNRGQLSVSSSVPPEDNVLSTREHEVLEQLSLGITNKEIADRLFISLATVKTHIINIYAKLGVSSRVMAVDEAEKRGILK